MDNRVLALIGFAIAGILGVIAWGVYWSFRKRQLQLEERRAMIDRGMTPPPEPPPPVQGWPGVRQREIDMKFAERRLMIEKGLPIPADCKPPDTPEERTRRGIMKVCVAVGIAVAYLLLNFVPTSLVADVADAQAWALGLGPLIGAWGLGQILSARFAPRADETREKTPGGSTT